MAEQFQRTLYLSVENQDTPGKNVEKSVPLDKDGFSGRVQVSNLSIYFAGDMFENCQSQNQF